VPAGAGKAGTEGPRGPPPGLKPLLPESAQQGWRPPVRESAKADLPPLEKAAEAAQALAGKVEAGAKVERASLVGLAATTQKKLGVVYARVVQPEQKERRQFAEVEAALDRRLRPAERVQIRALVAQNRDLAQIVAQFQKQADAEEEDFLRDLQQRLRRPLTPAERVRALRLHQEGRRAAEVADIFRS
jgi:hypothetical protein